MNDAFSARLRRLWLNIHLWIGLGLLLPIFLLSVSGSVLVWHDALDRMLHGDRYAVGGAGPALPASAYAAAAERAFGERARITQLRLPAEPGEPVVAVGRLAAPAGPGGRPRTLNVWIDPPSGRVLAEGEVARGLTMWLHRLHGSLMIPEIGRKVVGWLGWAMFASCATGLWLWWPRRGGAPAGLRWRRGSSTLYNLHHAVGFWICLPLAVLCLTGVYISFPKMAAAVFGLPAPPAREAGGARFAPPLAAPRLTVDEVTALAGAAGGEIRAVEYPQADKTPAWRVQVAGASGANRTIRLLDATGAVVEGRPQADRPALSRLMRQIHDGQDTGPLWRTIITLAGLAPPLLGVSGIVMWARRGRRSKAA